MNALVRRAIQFLKNEDGPTAVEYAIMMTLIIVVCMVAISTLGTNTSNTYTYVSNKVKTTSS